jgi:hypothetical protein
MLPASSLSHTPRPDSRIDRRQEDPVRLPHARGVVEDVVADDRPPRAGQRETIRPFPRIISSVGPPRQRFEERTIGGDQAVEIAVVAHGEHAILPHRGSEPHRRVGEKRPPRLAPSPRRGPPPGSRPSCRRTPGPTDRRRAPGRTASGRRAARRARARCSRLIPPGERKLRRQSSACSRSARRRRDRSASQPHGRKGASCKAQAGEVRTMSIP